MNPWDKIKNKFPRESQLPTLFGVILFAGLMTALLILVRAAGPFLSLEGEDAAVSGGAVVQADSTASGGDYVKFVGQSTPPPPPPTGSCSGVNVAAGSNLVNIANAHPGGTTFCLAAGQYNVNGNGIPLQNNDKSSGSARWAPPDSGCRSLTAATPP
jgi:hypothetical protein